MFGRPIGQNQGVQFPIARSYIEIEAAAQMVDKAARMFEAGEPCGTEANMAKLLASEASWRAADMCVQTHGGFGFAEEFDIERKFRETRLYQVAPISTNLILAHVAHACARPAEVLLMPGGALDGVLVVALEQAVAAPFCTSRLADAGARVIKIERASGDLARKYDEVAHGESAYFVWLNRGKQSLALDIKQPEDAALLKRILQKADVFVQNLAPGAAERAGFGAEALLRENPRLIVCDITGYGDSGPYAEMKAYDFLIQCETGLASITGGPDSPGASASPSPTSAAA